MIKGEQVNLRAVERSDAPDLYSWLNNPDAMRYWGLPSSSPSLARIQLLLEEWIDGELALGRPQCLIIETLQSEPIGFIQFGEFRSESRSSELSILIGDPQMWGQGIGTDAMEAVIDASFEDWNLRRLWCRAEAFNERAHRLFKRCGFTHEATLRDASFFEGVFHDVLVFGLLSLEYREA